MELALLGRSRGGNLLRVHFKEEFGALRAERRVGTPAVGTSEYKTVTLTSERENYKSPLSLLRLFKCPLQFREEGRKGNSAFPGLWLGRVSKQVP